MNFVCLNSSTTAHHQTFTRRTPDVPLADGSLFICLLACYWLRVTGSVWRSFRIAEVTDIPVDVVSNPEFRKKALQSRTLASGPDRDRHRQ